MSHIIRQHVGTVLTEEEQYKRETLMQLAEEMLKEAKSDDMKRRLRNIIVELGVEKHSNDELANELQMLGDLLEQEMVGQ